MDKSDTGNEFAVINDLRCVRRPRISYFRASGDLTGKHTQACEAKPVTALFNLRKLQVVRVCPNLNCVMGSKSDSSEISRAAVPSDAAQEAHYPAGTLRLGDDIQAVTKRLVTLNLRLKIFFFHVKAI